MKLQREIREQGEEEVKGSGERENEKKSNGIQSLQIIRTWSNGDLSG